ncbi:MULTISPECIES: stage III sporulation protein AF [Bacillus]|uniref:stage III sporulation protein AF n=1 Tax=Bacillus TaxID=1386 RepID=UPI0002F7A04F|nr:MULTISPECIES: stage III sporulation protein AF [Bacillus]
MSILTEWITSIIVFILLATVIDMLLPNSSFQKYAKMVIGLLLIAILISPIFKLLSTDFEDIVASMNDANNVEKGSMENEINMKKKEIQEAQTAYYLEEMAVQLKKEGEEELINQYNYQIKHIEVSTKNQNNPENSNDLDRVSVVLEKAEKQNESIETIQKIEINTQEPLPIEEYKTEEITKFLANVWKMDEEKIEIVFERRGSES